jgi:hypothetical protein
VDGHAPHLSDPAGRGRDHRRRVRVDGERSAVFATGEQAVACGDVERLRAEGDVAVGPEAAADRLPDGLGSVVDHGSVHALVGASGHELDLREDDAAAEAGGEAGDGGLGDTDLAGDEAAEGRPSLPGARPADVRPDRAVGAADEQAEVPIGSAGNCTTSGSLVPSKPGTTE